MRDKRSTSLRGPGSMRQALEMGQPAEKRYPATYADLEAVPPEKIAQIIKGTLYTLPRPSPRHTQTASVLGMKIGGPFSLGDGGPGGWWILDEPELHLGDDVLVPDIAGYRRERLPELPETAYFALAPDWVCEVLSPSNKTIDREEKMPIYAQEGVSHVWLIDPIARSLEVYELGADQSWHLLGTHRTSAHVRAKPFDAIELDLGLLWA